MFTYYVIRASYVIYPRYYRVTDFEKAMIIVQSIVTVMLVSGLYYSWKHDLNLVRVLLYLQAFQMILSNFNVYDREDSMNFEGLNMLSTSFSVMFTIYNLFLANMVVF